MQAAIDLNGQRASELAERIVTLRRQHRRWAFGMDLVSTLFALTLGVLLARAVRRAVEERDEAPALEAGRFVGFAQRADVAKIVAAAVDELQATAKEKAVELRVEPVEAAQAECPPSVLASIVSSLVESAIRTVGGAPPRRVTVRATEAAGMERIEVRSTTRDEPAVPDRDLAIVTAKRLVEAHGGRFGGEATPEHGWLRWFELPRVKPST
jgi:signal transduction histidine kinase